MRRILTGKIALVTGASRGIGRQIALKLAAEGALVALHFGTQAAKAASLAEEIAGTGGEAFPVGADLALPASIPALFETIDKELRARGRDGLDILVNNAGIGMVGDVQSIAATDVDRAFAINVKALLFVTQHALARLRDGGRIINLSSMVSQNAYPGAIAYAATKAAVDSITVSLAAGLGRRGITVNAVAPGATRTDFIAPLMGDPVFVRMLEEQAVLGRIGEADDIADVVAFLASDAARWITGERVRASGGMHL